MRADVVFLHTAAVHVETFRRLLAQTDDSLKGVHVVAEELLDEARRVGADDPDLRARVQQAMTNAAVESGARVAVCTCSTIGGAAERTDGGGRFAAMRIDRAMADRAVRSGPRVLVVAALESTLLPTGALLAESAAAAGLRVDARNLLVEVAWPHFLAGDVPAYLRSVADAVQLGCTDADVVVLAQASMAPAAAMLSHLGVEVLASPRLGVERVVQVANASR